ncbi:2-oxo-4-hydroxy-4-carboxy-5-ureidoimidazoline decarboxylase [Nocardia ninae]
MLLAALPGHFLCGDTPGVIYLFRVAAGRVVFDAGPMTDDGAGLAGFHALPAHAATEALLTCCSSPEWARALVAARPYPSVDTLLDTADAVLAELPESEIDRALAGHPRIGERPDTAASAREQAGVATAADAVRSALAAGNRAYEARFGHLYLVCASGRSGSELLAILEDRLGNDAETERRVMRTELAKINRIRLRALLAATR